MFLWEYFIGGPGLLMEVRKRSDRWAGRKGRINKVKGNCWEGKGRRGGAGREVHRLSGNQRTERRPVWAECTGQWKAAGRSQTLLGVTIHVKDFELSSGKPMNYFQQRGDILDLHFKRLLQLRSGEWIRLWQEYAHEDRSTGYFDFQFKVTVWTVVIFTPFRNPNKISERELPKEFWQEWRW